jgi:ABC-type Fe3+ transport system substrate-binding protein
VHAAAKHPDAARELIKFITSPAARPFIEKTGMQQG